MFTLEHELESLAEPRVAALIARERREVFSLQPEVRVAGWAGATLFAAAAGIVLKNNLERIGPLALAVMMGIAAAACYAFVWWRRERASIADDYVLLLGALLAHASVSLSMMTVAQERARLLRERLEAEGLHDLAETIRVDWRSHGVVLRVVLFVLACIGLTAFYFFLDLMQMLRPGIVTGAVAIALAELLIHRFRWFGTGIEEALWIGGMFALVSELPRSGEPESMLVLAAAAAIPGLRVRNPLFGAVAANFVVQYFELRFDRGVVVALAIATFAALALLRTWRRPSTEWLWIALVVTMPVAGRFEADPIWRDMTILLYGAFAALTLTLAVRKRHHALFAGGGIALAIAATDLAQKLDAPLEAKLAAAGALLLAASWFVSRALRERSRGFVLTPVKLTTDDDALDIATTLVSSGAASAEHADPTEKPGGGRFGGAGATGDY